ncbi:CAP domain-containing protein, partial [Candidatus Kapabacteria bacterium]|nr:CAP domain-containing protein [Candidatus Kapabacteria bacterium]
MVKYLLILFISLIIISCDEDDGFKSVATDPSQSEIDQFLLVHNQAREEVNVGLLVWSDSLASYAKEWAIYLANNNCKFEHRPNEGAYKQIYGENLYSAWSSDESFEAKLEEGA